MYTDSNLIRVGYSNLTTIIVVRTGLRTSVLSCIIIMPTSARDSGL